MLRWKQEEEALLLNIHLFLLIIFHNIIADLQ